MINSIISDLKNKNILILGFGREGKSSFNFIKKYLPNANVTIADKNHIDLENVRVNTIVGDNYLDSLNEFDIILKSPGISLKHVDVDESKISSQLDLLLKHSTVKTIGITGTKGKTTTSTLIYNILKGANKNCFLLGNIGVPVFECLLDITCDSILVIEMSSHQLEFMRHSPNISIVTNYYQEHLDHYLDYEHYINAKLNIFKYQKEDDVCIYNIDQQEYLPLIDAVTCCNKVNISCTNPFDNLSSENFAYINSCNLGNIFHPYKHYVFLDNEYYINKRTYSTSKKYFCIKDLNQNLIGKHHFYDVLFAFTVCNILDIDNEEIRSILRQFKGIPHRMEYVGKFNDIIFYNDSIATIPQAVIHAINSLKIVDTLIIGGMDRGIDYTEFANFLACSSINNVICLYETGKKISNMMLNINPDNSNKIYIAKDLEDAVNTAFLRTKKNHICLLSPAAASYGYFKNFEERGNEYKRLIQLFSNK